MKESKSRVEAISDSIFAFAATLVVVSLDIPEDFTELKASLGSFIPFGISFFALVMIWRTHYNFFRRSQFVDTWVIALNMMMLFVVLFYVYPLKFLANLAFGEAKISGWDQFAELFELYSLGFAAIFFFLGMMYFAAARKPATNAKLMRFWGRHFLIFTGMGILSIILSLTGVGLRIGLPGFVYALLGPLCYLHARLYGGATETEEDATE
ncbi:TMEM175 family protein [Lewinella sp. W8]|uniref:TMEM175 family protein n=1 Tax=Lewinella sp. W8 TaxID=2528208 RepID=UPI001067D0CB|nr:TMEM175 family protein [Lewinella sp. W8]MTB50224.1 DUF1211 domain-containing protein [Lewinella sp. W8]